jgi:DNA-binding FrmR family transcriptional regulator
VVRILKGSLTAIEASLDSHDETGEVWSQIQAELHAQEVVDVKDKGPQKAVTTTTMAPLKTKRAKAATVASQVSPRRSKRVKK